VFPRTQETQLGDSSPSFVQRLLLRKAEDTESVCRTAILSLLNHAPGARLIDLGCGDGEFTWRAAEKVGTSDVYGVDIVEENLTRARQRGIVTLGADLNRELPFGTGTVDVICASHVIEHLNDTDMFLKEVSRILKREGYSVIATPNLAAWHHIAFLLLGKQPTIAEVSDMALVGTWSPRGRWVARVGPAHRRIFTMGALTGLIEYYGLQVEKIVGSGFLPLSGHLASLFGTIDKRHATNIVVRARKPK